MFNMKIQRFSISCIALILFLFISLSAFAQNNAAATTNVQVTEAVYKAENPGWLVNLDEAYAKSKATGKPILANFTGSDWCGWCFRLRDNVFVKDEFKKWAEENVILLELDFPRRKSIPENIKQQNTSLQQAFQVTGYPTVWVFNLSKDEKTNQFNIEKLGRTGYTPSVEEFTAGVDQMIKK
jgi:thiol:disulfide interchange protein